MQHHSLPQIGPPSTHDRTFLTLRLSTLSYCQSFCVFVLAPQYTSCMLSHIFCLQRTRVAPTTTTTTTPRFLPTPPPSQLWRPHSHAPPLGLGNRQVCTRRITFSAVRSSFSAIKCSCFIRPILVTMFCILLYLPHWKMHPQIHSLSISINHVLLQFGSFPCVRTDELPFQCTCFACVHSERTGLPSICRRYQWAVASDLYYRHRSTWSFLCILNCSHYRHPFLLSWIQKRESKPSRITLDTHIFWALHTKS